VSLERLIDLVFFVVLVVIAIRLVPVAGRILRMYLTIRSRRLEDSTASAPPEPAPVTTVTDRLAAIGFSRIGVRSAVLPDGIRRFEWNLVDQPTTTYVSLVPVASIASGVLMICYSAFGDDAFVDTMYPSGATVRRSDLDAAPAGTSPEEAVQAHYQRVSSFASRHGQPLANRSMADLLIRDDTYRRRHGGATMRKRVYVLVAVTVAIVVAAAAELVRLVAFDR
jgi:hypothetical protein